MSRRRFRNYGTMNIRPSDPPHPEPPSVLRRSLNRKEAAARRAELGAAPEALRDWEAEQRLSRALDHLPAAEVPPDFTRRVLAAIEREPTPAAGGAGLWRPWPGWSSWLPRAAVAAVLLALPLLWWQQSAARGERLAVSVATVAQPVQETAQAVQMPPVEVLMDFEAIDQMRRLSSMADDGLLACLEVGSP